MHRKHVKGGNPLCKCGNLARQGQRKCTACHASYMRHWRKGRALSPAERLKDACRSKTHYLVKTGRLEKKPCEQCGCIDVEAHHPDYDRPDLVNWLCRIHHQEHHMLERMAATLQRRPNS